MEELKVWPNLLRQFETPYAVCKLQFQNLKNTVQKPANNKTIYNPAICN